MLSRIKHAGPQRPSFRESRGQSWCLHTVWTARRGVLAVALVIGGWYTLVPTNATADERDRAIEQHAFEIDSANGLLASRQSQKFLGARSCAASACHGGIEPDPRFPLSRRNEYVHWLDKDPHAGSYQTLKNELSKAILERLSRASDDDATHANRLANCFACHNPQPDQAQHSETFYNRDAVSCEICHGPAEAWIGPHVVPETWKDLKQTGGAARLGFIDTKNIATRAQSCVSCHVGSPGREVNHDLIAAGHPALKFELASYHAMLPKHWRDGEERRSTPQLEIELWKAGQLACGEAAIDLLNWRAQRTVDQRADAVWPEFAEYDCYACHHDLVHPSWRQTGTATNVPLGMSAWGSWYFSQQMPTASDGILELTKHMQSSFRPDPAAVIDCIEEVRLGAPRIDADVRLPTNWDDATQQYLALVAIEQAQRDSGNTTEDDLTVAITRLRSSLAFPTGFDSPSRLFEPGDMNGTRTDIHKSLLDLMKQLQGRGKP